MAYDWVKAFHVIAVISWMAGMLYLPRLFVYHSETPKGSIQSDTFKIMERRLLKAIMTPAMIAHLDPRPDPVWQGGWITSGWLHAKFLLVIALSGLHGFLSKTVRGIRRRPERSPGEILPDDQRGSDRSDDRHRHPGDREAILKSCVPASIRLALSRFGDIGVAGQELGGRGLEAGNDCG